MMFVGVGKSRMASRYFLHGWTLVEVISKPANSTVSAIYSFVWVEDDANVATDVEPLNCFEEALEEIVGPEKPVVNAFGLVRDMRDNLINLLE